MDEQEERDVPDWKASYGFPLGTRSYWIADQFGNRYGEAILFFKGDGRVFARLLLTVSMSDSVRNQILQSLYDEFDFFKNLECTVWQASDLGTFETLKNTSGS